MINISKLMILMVLILFLMNCATTTQQWSRVIELPEKLTEAEKGDEVILILKNKKQIKGIFMGREINLVLLNVINPKTNETSLKTIQYDNIRGVLIKREYKINPIKRIIVTIAFIFVIAYYFGMRAFGEGLS